MALKSSSVMGGSYSPLTAPPYATDSRLLAPTVAATGGDLDDGSRMSDERLASLDLLLTRMLEFGLARA